MEQSSLVKSLSKLTFGGLRKLTNESIELRKLQINDNFRLHSCYDYNEALDVIKIASEETKIIPKLITKVYFNFNTIPIRYFTILEQMHRIVDRLKFIPKDWHIQICVNPSFKEFNNKNYALFKEKVNKNYGDLNYFIETESLWEKNTSRIIKSNYVDGSCFFMNGIVRGIRNECFMQKPFITFGMLAGGHKHNTKYKNAIIKQNNNDTKNIIEKNIIFFLKLAKNKNFNYSISSVSSKKNYTDLINTIKSIENSYNFLDDKIQIDELIDFFKYETCSSYGLKYNKFYKKFFFNKKRVIHEIISLLPFINLSKKWL
jgi:hypothetical protein|tara:strand:+ start:472 stop:1419 length:948 start_codon:yes stop_codon:yes gene_type:complete